MKRVFTKIVTNLSWYPIYNLYVDEFAFSDIPPPPETFYWVNENGDKFIDGEGNFIVFAE